MRFRLVGVVALLGGLSLVSGCGASNIQHGDAGGNGAGGAGSGGTGANGGGSGGASGGDNCGVMNFMLAKGGTPDLLIVQDRSASMAQDASGGTGMPSKWTAITQAIEQVVSSVTNVDWGLMFFGPDGFFGCTVSSTPQVACGPNTAAAINSAIAATSPTTSTPTAEAMQAAIQYYQGNNDGRDHYVLLSTDGLPACGLTDEVTAAEGAVADAAKAGIKTIVVGIGTNTMADATLTTMANNGGLPNATPGEKPYYEVNTTADLVKVLQTVAGQIVSCSYPLTMAPPNPDFVEIDGNGKKIPRDPTHTNGWDFGPNNLSIDFYGPACADLQQGVTTSVSAIFGCTPVG